MKRSILSLIALVLALALAPLLSHGQTPNPPGQISYQGYLTDANGIALATNAPRNFNVIFRIYSASSGDTNTGVIWAEQQVVTVDRGYFTVMLGAGSGISGAFNTNNLSTIFTGPTASDRYIGITVQGLAPTDVEVTPRLRLLASPYSFLASSALSISATNVLTAANFSTNVGLWTATPTNIYRLGTVGINGTGSAAGLAVAGGIQSASFVNTHSQGAYLEWNKDATSGYTYLLNQKGNGGGGLLFGEISTANVITEQMRIDGSGRIRIGNSGPTYLLDVGGSFRAANANGSFEFDGYGPGAGAVLEGAFTGVAHGPQVRFTGAPGGAFHDIGQIDTGDFVIERNDSIQFDINSGGNVGIGGISATHGRLEINGFAGSYSLPAANRGFFSAAGGSLITYPAQTVGSSIYANSDIVTVGSFIAISDARVKNIVGKSDGIKDLAALLGIEITDYSYKDVVTKGSAMHKKVIAQQVEKVFPEAVKKTTDCVPDIYQHATIKDGWISINTDLHPGERVRLISDKDGEGVHEVLEVAKGKFRTEFKPGGDHIFVFGREVNDFRSVNYDAISMLNVSATQELARRLQKLESREAHLAELEQKAARLTTLETEMADLKKMVAQLTEAAKATKVAAQPAPKVEAARTQPFTTASLDR